MLLLNKKYVSVLSAGLLVLALFLNGCGYERIRPKSGELTAPYSASEFHQELPDTGSNLHPPLDFDAFCLEVFQDEMKDCSTLDLHYTMLHPERYDIKSETITLGTYKLSDMITNNKKLKTLRSRLLEFDRESLDAIQKVTYDALLETLNTQLMAEGLELYEQPLAPTIGVQAQLPILLAEYTFHSLEDVENYLALVEQLDTYYREILSFEQMKADAGLGPSDASIDAIISSCNGYLENPFLSETFLTRLNRLQQDFPLTETQSADLIQRHESAISNHFIPAYELLISGLSDLKGHGINPGGLCGFANGSDYYEYLVKSRSGVSYSVPKLKAALTTQMKKNIADMNQLYVEFPDLNDRLSTKAAYLTDPASILEDLKQQMAADFPILPECDYKISYVPSALEDVLSPAFYLTAPLDDTDQNIIYINQAYEDSGIGLYTTLAHEGFPGHLYQTIYSRNIQQETPLLSVLTCSGANEGWATYVEHLAHTYEQGLQEGVGQYYALLRSYSLCVHGLLDIGIHYEGWTKEMSDAFVSSCFQVDQETLDALWQTILDNPANYLDYCGGFVEILEMREDAELALGPDFSLLAFHTFLLDIGPLPFSVIRSHFAEWLQAQI